VAYHCTRQQNKFTIDIKQVYYEKFNQSINVLVLAFTVASCSKSEADQSENLNPTAKQVDKSNTDYIWVYKNHGAIPELTFHFAKEVENVKAGDRVELEVNDNGHIFTMSTKVLDAKQFRILNSNMTWYFSDQIGNENKDKEITVKVVGHNAEAHININGMGFLLGLKQG